MGRMALRTECNGAAILLNSQPSRWVFFLNCCVSIITYGFGNFLWMILGICLSMKPYQHICNAEPVERRCSRD